jgi:hypothetical protein
MAPLTIVAVLMERKMLQMWPMLFGWPAILVAIALPVVGIVRKKPAWLVAGAVIIFPISLYLAAMPRFRWFALIFPVMLYASSVAVRHSRYWLAWSLLIPVVAFFTWLAVAVLNQ